MNKEELFSVLSKAFKTNPSHAYLIVTNNIDYATNSLLEYLKDLNVYKIIKDDTIKKEDAISILKEFSLKSFDLDKRYLLVSDFSFITLEAENSLLKFIEEPPSNTHIFLIASNKEAILPTILSRVTLLDLEFNQFEYFNYLKSLDKYSILDAFILSLLKSDVEDSYFITLKEMVLDYFNISSRDSSVLFFLKYKEFNDFIFFDIILNIYTLLLRDTSYFSSFNILKKDITRLYFEILIVKDLDLKKDLNIKFKNILHELIIKLY